MNTQAKKTRNLVRQDLTLEQGLEFLVCDEAAIMAKYNVSKSTHYRITKSVENYLSMKLNMTPKMFSTQKIGF